MTDANDLTSSTGTPASKDDKLKIGDRIKLSDLGKSRSPRMTCTGSVVSIRIFRNGFGRVSVLLDGSACPVQLHSTYVERE